MGSETRVIVVGAGIVGTCIAYELAKRGARVALVDADEPGRGCSFGNSGAISEGSVAPLAMPGIIRAAAKMLLDAQSPLRIPLSYLPRALPWLTQFVASAKPERVETIARALRDLNMNAVANHVRLAEEIGAPELLVQRGHLHLYPDDAALVSDAASWHLRERYGVRFERLDRTGILELEPRVGARYVVGILLADHATVIDPFRYVVAIAKTFVARGGTLVRERVSDVLSSSTGEWICRTDKIDHVAEHVVIAAGVWSAQFLRPLGIELPLESQRGYHVTFRGVPSPISRTVALADRKVFLLPMEDGFRIGGTVEFGGLGRPPDFRRSAQLAGFARDTFDVPSSAQESHWMGHRPCMPDSLPRIGPLSNRRGLWLAVGHGHLGLTGSVNTALLLAPQIMGTQ